MARAGLDVIDIEAILASLESWPWGMEMTVSQNTSRALEGRVAIVTGAGRGLGREHALFLASEGAKVVVNDLGGSLEGSGADPTAAEAVVEEIRLAGGEAVASGADVSDWNAGKRLVQKAIDTFGDLHVVVNNAGIIRDEQVTEMSEAQWDAVVNVHLKGHFVTIRHAAAYWRAQHESGREVRASVVNTASRAGLFPARPNKDWKPGPGEGKANYTAAKAGIAALTLNLALELEPYDVRVNAIAPVGRTRLTGSKRHLTDWMKESEGNEFDAHDPANVAPVVGWLATEDCTATGQVYFVFGGEVQPLVGWTRAAGVAKDGRWSIEELRAQQDHLQVAQPAGDAPGEGTTGGHGGQE
jgi:NAD(P)-dependent dehydrogenase (short-subunit alcohol dehydrogenase family)